MAFMGDNFRGNGMTSAQVLSSKYCAILHRKETGLFEEMAGSRFGT